MPLGSPPQAHSASVPNVPSVPRFSSSASKGGQPWVTARPDTPSCTHLWGPMACAPHACLSALRAARLVAPRGWPRGGRHPRASLQHRSAKRRDVSLSPAGPGGDTWRWSMGEDVLWSLCEHSCLDAAPGHTGRCLWDHPAQEMLQKQPVTPSGPCWQEGAAIPWPRRMDFISWPSMRWR